jgi:hypothetical protein
MLMGATPPSEIDCVLGLHQEMCDKQLNVNGDHRQRIEPTPVGVHDEVNKELIGVLDAAIAHVHGRSCENISKESHKEHLCLCTQDDAVFTEQYMVEAFTVVPTGSWQRLFEA